MAEEKPTQPRKWNRLIHAKSPYLRQHADNPVDWYPWGPEALEKARREDKPIFLSIGYSSCHWCHVMEEESFRNPEIAAILNEHFVSIKVDREERPDLDRIYMQAVIAMTGSGGWPLNVFLTPDLKPFFGGTYFPPEDRWGRPGFKRILLTIARAWKERRQEIEQSAERLTRLLREALQPTASAQIEYTRLVQQAVQTYRSSFDAVHGGFGGPPKFPPHAALRFLIRYAFRTRDAEVLQMVETTLHHMAMGGIYDQIGGGFHRYSVDAEWHVPHFEKMLYDNAQLALIYAEAFAATHNGLYYRIANETLHYLYRDMRDPEGAFYTAEDADSEGREGAFYTWTYDEILQVLGKTDGPRFAEQFGVTPEGNFEHGENVLHVARPFAQMARKYRMRVEEWMEWLHQTRRKLREVRARRPRPLRDEKILTDWNGLAISGFAWSGFYLQQPWLIEAAERAADWLMRHMWDAQTGQLYHRYMEGARGVDGLLTDYTYLAQGLLDLFELTGRSDLLAHAIRLMDRAIELFWDDTHGGFYDAAPDHPDYIVPVRETFDGATPSGNSVALWNLYRIFEITGIQKYRDRADAVVAAFSGTLAQDPTRLIHLVAAWDFAQQKPYEIVIVVPSDEIQRAAYDQLAGLWFPYKVIVWQHARRPLPYPALRDKRAIRGRLTIYACRDFTCLQPIHDIRALLPILDRAFTPESTETGTS